MAEIQEGNIGQGAGTSEPGFLRTFLADFLLGGAGLTTLSQARRLGMPQAAGLSRDQIQELINAPYRQAQNLALKEEIETKPFRRAKLESDARESEQRIKLLEAQTEEVKRKSKQTDQDIAKAKSFERSTGIPAEEFVGIGPSGIQQKMVLFRQGAKQAEALLQTQNQLQMLQNAWNKIAPDAGVLEGRAKSLASSLTGGAIKPDILAYENMRKAAATTIRSIFKDSGAPSNFDVERLLNALPSVTKSGKVATPQWEMINGMLSSGKASLIQANPLTNYIFNKQSGAQSQANMPSQNVYLQTATNPKTGQKIGKRQDGKWEIISNGR